MTAAASATVPAVVSYRNPFAYARQNSLPSRLAETFASLVPLKVMPPPVSLPVFDVTVYWHERFNDDPANQWFRRAFITLFRA